jgi:hypothetical protein
VPQFPFKNLFWGQRWAWRSLEVFCVSTQRLRALGHTVDAVEEKLPANGELIPPGLNWLRRLCSSQGQTRFVGRIVKAPALGSWDTFNGG